MTFRARLVAVTESASDVMTVHAGRRSYSVTQGCGMTVPLSPVSLDVRRESCGIATSMVKDLALCSCNCRSRWFSRGHAAFVSDLVKRDAVR